LSIPGSAIIGTANRPRILLAEIYGSNAADEIWPRFDELVNAHSLHQNRAPEHLHDVRSWLIAYPDHISGADMSSLSTLGRFVSTRLRPQIDGVHILPCFPWSTDDGFSVMDYTQIDERYGTWTDVEHIGEAGGLMLDAVVNHASVRGKWFEAWRSGDEDFESFFRTEDPGADLSGVVRAREHPLLTTFETPNGNQSVWTTFSEDQADLDYRNPNLLLAIVGVLLDYARHGATAIRLDAVGFLWKEAGTPSIHLPETHMIVQLMRAVLDMTYPDVLLVSETNVPHRENISYLGDGWTPEADMVYQFPLPPLTLHAFGTGDATVLRSWLETINGIPPTTTYFNFLASHDGVGLRPLEGLVDATEVQDIVDACVENGGLVKSRTDSDGNSVPYELNGTWFDLIRGSHADETAMQRHIASHALMFSLRGEPAIYLQALLAEPNDVDLAIATSESRSINRRRFSINSLNAVLDDPSTHAAKSLSALLEMLAWRSASEAFQPVATQRVLETPSTVVGIERSAPSGATASVFVNVSDTPVTLPASNTGDVRGFGVTSSTTEVHLAPYGVAWIFSHAPPEK
jgi:glycosidase